MKRLVFALALFAVGGAASAQLVDELRLGVLAHDIGLFGGNAEDGADLNAEVRFGSPSFLRWAFSPRPHLGASINTSGATNQVYFGLTWTATLFRDVIVRGDGLFVELALGGAVHDGKIDTIRTDRKSLGSRVLFRESFEIGWAFTPSQSISFMLDHMSNANLAERNEGLDNFGIRYGLKF
jgi:lipid A 3-O-deacylase